MKAPKRLKQVFGHRAHTGGQGSCFTVYLPRLTQAATHLSEAIVRPSGF